MKNMKSARAALPTVAGLAAALGLIGAAQAQGQPQSVRSAQVGAVYLLTRSVEMAGSDSEGSSSSSSDSDALVERVVAIHHDGVELEYDLPRSATAEVRLRTWQLPLRVLKTAAGPAQLLNRDDLERRVTGWLKAAQLPRSACGHWAFTWTAIHIECDPDSALSLLDAVDLGQPTPHAGDAYTDPAGIGAANLITSASGAGGVTLVAQFALDPETVRREEADQDVVLAEITHATTALAEAEKAHADEQISGSVEVTLQMGADGEVRRRTRRIITRIKNAKGVTSTRTVTEVVDRKSISGD